MSMVDVALNVIQDKKFDKGHFKLPTDDVSIARHAEDLERA